MNKRGIYASIMAVLVVATIAMVIYSGLATVNEESTSHYINLLMDTKRVWQDSRFVLDKAVSDALADYVKDKNILTGVCSDDVSGADVEKQVKDYLTTDLEQIGNPDKGEIKCSLDSFNYAPAGNIATVTVKLKCEQTLKEGNDVGFYVSYAKNVIYKKQVTVSGPTCTVTVTDLQSNETDVVLS